MDRHYLAPLFSPQSVVVFAGRLDDPAGLSPQARALHDALRAQHFAGTLQFLDVRTSGTLADLAQTRADLGHHRAAARRTWPPRWRSPAASAAARRW